MSLNRLDAGEQTRRRMPNFLHRGFVKAGIRMATYMLSHMTFIHSLRKLLRHLQITGKVYCYTLSRSTWYGIAKDASVTKGG